MIGPGEDSLGSPMTEAALKERMAAALRVVLAAPVGQPLAKAVLRPESPLRQVFPDSIVPLADALPRPMLFQGPCGPFVSMAFLLPVAELEPSQVRALAQVCAPQRPVEIVVGELEAQRLFSVGVTEIVVVITRGNPEQTMAAPAGPGASVEGGL